MRRRLIVTVAAAVTMVLVAMLVPMAVLMRGYALEDRLSRAALEVQATETVVAFGDRGSIAVYLDRINDDEGTSTTVLFPGGTEAIGPDPGESDQVREARETGLARVDDVAGGTQMLIPVSLGSSADPAQTPVIRVIVDRPGLSSKLFGALLVLLLLGLGLLAGALLLADRLGRSFVQPIRSLADYAGRLGRPGRSVEDERAVEVTGPEEVRELATALNRLVGRVQTLVAREREANADISHRLRTPMTALRLRLDGVDDPEQRERLAADLDELQMTVDGIIREARRSEREGLVVATDSTAVVRSRVDFWRLLAEEQDRELTLTLPPGPTPVRIPEEDLTALLDVLLDNVFTHAAPPATARVTLTGLPEGGARIVVEDAGPGFPVGADVLVRGASGGGSTGLGLAIVARTAAASGGDLTVGRSDLGGARVTVDLGGA